MDQQQLEILIFKNRAAVLGALVARVSMLENPAYSMQMTTPRREATFEVAFLAALFAPYARMLRKTCRWRHQVGENFQTCGSRQPNLVPIHAPADSDARAMRTLGMRFLAA